MSQVDLTEAGFVDKRIGRGVSHADSDPIAERANYGSIKTLKTRLQALNGTYYTNARINTMTKNDMIYALRSLGDATGI